jgi:hypothetical protein
MPRDGGDDTGPRLHAVAIAESSATLQTVRKLRSDVLLRLWRRGSIDDIQRLSADEIRETWMILSRGLFASGRMDASLPAEKRGRRNLRDPYDRFSSAQRRRYENRYRPWIAETGRMKVGGSHRLSGLTHEILVENRGPRQIDRAWRLRNGTAVQLLRDSLDLYAAFAECDIKTNR